MSGEITDLSFVTHLEIEGLLGGGPSGGQQRRRLVSRGLLPEPCWVRFDRQRLGILPEFALAGLAVPPRKLDSRHTLLFEAIVKDAQRLYESTSFGHLAKAVRDSLQNLGPAMKGPGLVDLLGKEYSRELDAWRVDVATVTEDLARLGLGIEVERGYIAEVLDDAYVLQPFDADVTESHPRSDAPFDLADGLWVVRDRVRALSSARDFLLPTYGPAEGEASIAAVHPGLDGDEAMFEEMFGSLAAAPRPIRRLPLIVDEESEYEPANVPPQLVSAPVELLQGFTPMTRPRV